MATEGQVYSGGGEFRGSGSTGTALISGVTVDGQLFTQRSVTYFDIDGSAILEGDIFLGSVEAVEARNRSIQRQAAQQVAHGIGITGDQFRWPRSEIPYSIDEDLPNPQRVTDAIAHWEANTRIRFIVRTDANASAYPNYLQFGDFDGCWSAVGMRGGRQDISLGPRCGTGSAIHEIGHAVGLWHEQSREDRDRFVTIHYQNIESGMAAQFDQHIRDGDDLGPYDYGSIMHYPRDAFSKNREATITPVDPNIAIGQRDGLSPGDIGAVEQICSRAAT